MMIELFELLSYFGLFLDRFPMWVNALLGGIHLLAILVCILLHRRDRVTNPTKKSHNTVHTLFWVMLMLMLPIVGILLYIAGSLVPYLLWKKRSGGATVFPYAYRLRRRQPTALLSCGCLGMAIDWCVESKGTHLQDFPLGFELAALCWVLLTVLDWNQAYRGKAVFLRMKPTNVEAVPVIPGTPLFGRRHMMEQLATVEPTRFGAESRLARAAADAAFSEESGTPIATEGTVTVAAVPDKEGNAKGQNKLNAPQSPVEQPAKATQAEQAAQPTQWDFQLIMPEGLQESKPDVVDARYLGRGVTRYRVADWVTNEEENETICIERVWYRVTPRMRFLLIRSGVLLTMLVALFTPLWSTVQLGLLWKIYSIICG